MNVHGRVQKKRKFRWPKLTRDAALFIAGLGLTINEALFHDGERPYLLVMFAGMMGLPIFFRNDEKKQGDEDDA